MKEPEPKPQPNLREMARQLREKRAQQERAAMRPRASQNHLYKDLPKSLRPDYYPSEIPFVQEFEKRFHELWPWENGVFTRSLEYFYRELGSEASEVMTACLAATRAAKVRGDPKTSPHARYLYRVLEAQVKGQRGEPGYSKRRVTR